MLSEKQNNTLFNIGIASQENTEGNVAWWKIWLDNLISLLSAVNTFNSPAFATTVFVII